MLATGKSGKVLFFGKQDCEYTKRAIDHVALLGFETTTVLSKHRQEELPAVVGQWSGDYIFCFRSYFVLSDAVLSRARIAAINFHPAPAEYPGSGCLNWALYDRADRYGVTAHIMNERVDNGPIIECRRFPILPQDDVRSLLARTHLKTLDLIFDITTGLAMEGRRYLERKLEASRNETWRGMARKMREIDQLQVIPADCSRDELERIIRATYTPEYPPEIRLHGYRFVLKI